MINFAKLNVYKNCDQKYDRTLKAVLDLNDFKIGLLKTIHLWQSLTVFSRVIVVFCFFYILYAKVTIEKIDT